MRYLIFLIYTSSVLAFSDQFPLQQLMTGNQKLLPKGPVIQRHSDFRYTVLFGENKKNGYMEVYYNKKHSLERTETYNNYGFKISWTTFNEKGEMEVAYDLGELGRADRWERIESKDDGLEKVFYVVEVMDLKTRTRKEVSREIIDGTQFCNTVMGLPLADSTARDISNIANSFRGTAECPSFNQSGITSSDGQNVTFVSQGPICVDNNCGYDPARVETFVQETVVQGAQCMAALSMARFSDTERRRAESSESRFTSAARATGNEAYLRKSMALRNAVRLLMLTNQSSTFSDYYSPTEQGILAVNGDGEVANVTSSTTGSRIIRRLQRPIKIFCGSTTRLSLTENVRNSTSSATETNTVQNAYNTGGLAYASAVLPGMAGWPAVKLRALSTLSTGADTMPGQGDKAILFHEMMHLIGYPHNEQASMVGGQRLPLHTACQACCFPEGFTNTSSEHYCNAQKADPNNNPACKMCAGDYGRDPRNLTGTAQTEYEAGRANYLRYIRACFNNGNPL